jgi:hypothetical protein
VTARTAVAVDELAAVKGGVAGVIYLVGLVGIAFVAFFFFVVDKAIGRILFYGYYALHLASDRDRFVRGYSNLSRAVGALMICVTAVALGLRAFE